MRVLPAVVQIFALTFLLSLSHCNSSSVDDAIEIIEGVPRKTIDTDKLGTNAFLSDARFGSPSSQLAEVQNTVRLNFVRMLFNWSDGVQPGPGSEPDFSFYDSLAASIPSGMDAIVVLTGIPNWMKNPANWRGGDPRRTFAEIWVRKVAQRYAGNGRIIGWQIWNEPNMEANGDNITMDLASNPGNYIQLLSESFNEVRKASPQKLVISAATTAINQNFPGTLDYNRAMRDAGILSFCDIYAIHYYGRQYENVVRGGGVADYLNGLSKEIWVTETGFQSVNGQLEYGEQTWPFLRDKIPGIERIYQYQFVEGTPAASTYALRNLTAGSQLSDLYIYLRDR